MKGLNPFFVIVVLLLVSACQPLIVPVDEVPDRVSITTVTSYDAQTGEFPESIAFDRQGNIYLSFGTPATPLAQIRQIDPDGVETVLVDFAGPAPAGLVVDATATLYYAYVSFDPESHGVYRLANDGPVERLLGTEAIGLPNALTCDEQGTLYVSDSILGAIWRVPSDGPADLWLQHPFLAGLGEIPNYPPLGANGIAMKQEGLYVANTEKGSIVHVPILANGEAGEPELVVEDPALYGLDGIALHPTGTIYAVSVLQDKLFSIDPDSGEFRELAEVSDVLDEPSSLAFGVGESDYQRLYVTNYGIFPEDGTGPGLLRIEMSDPGKVRPMD